LALGFIPNALFLPALKGRGFSRAESPVSLIVIPSGFSREESAFRLQGLKPPIWARLFGTAKAVPSRELLTPDS